MLDAFGGDNAPDAPVLGALKSIKETNINVIFCGDENKIKNIIKNSDVSSKKIKIIHAPEIINTDDPPTEAINNKKASSMVVGLGLLANDQSVHGFISAGNSGALLVGTTLIVKRDIGVKRIAFAVFLPKENGFSLLVDCGANSDCNANMLHKFGVLGSEYVKSFLDIRSPKVGLLNIGTEENKGDNLRLEAFDLLEKDTNINFTGNIEPDRILMRNDIDVIVSDGFTGNIILKSLEGCNSFFMGKIKEIFSLNMKTKLGAMLIKNEIKIIKKSINYREHGGASLLGAKKPVFKVHGKSDAETFRNAINKFGTFIANRLKTE
ncbi:MAG: phosphate acyltransferase PlsX [Candidatus Improbicoccus pseudotrichonymphae]|uniref:Phosphate acyltransferase n=1 Tax=Candidatus Improbicoccus pseudotrichonymphae TaxID=3033792 RepID=A0AA48I172_9FIRM|nr:MAG: phosphate acyltransferase PlsX [Candidatus Improbicoccus pseudotrichonymphae]